MIIKQSKVGIKSRAAGSESLQPFPLREQRFKEFATWTALIFHHQISYHANSGSLCRIAHAHRARIQIE